MLFLVKLFYVNIYKQTFPFLTPSIHSALSMTSMGARGETAKEMDKLLQVLSRGPSTHQIYRELITEVTFVSVFR